MTSVNLRFQIADVAHTLGGIETRLEDPSPLMQDVLLVELRSVQRRFEAQGSPERWHELAQATIQQRLGRTAKGRKAREAVDLRRTKLSGKKAVASQNRYIQQVGAMQILRNTGLLLQSIGGSASGPFSTADGRGESDQTTAGITTSNPGAWNQFANARTGAPARIIFAWEEQDVDDVQAMAADFVTMRGSYAG